LENLLYREEWGMIASTVYEKGEGDGCHEYGWVSFVISCFGLSRKVLIIALTN